MADRPIIFSGPMVRALIKGRKTQTRRALKGKSGVLAARSVMRQGLHWMGLEYDRAWPLRLPYAPGDRLWVREAIDKVSEPGNVFYRADYEAEYGEAPPRGWRPSIHMPRWASRLTLAVTDVRVQRLQEISEADARAEGVDISQQAQWGGLTHRFPFECLWNSLHGPDAWDANPWVCALTFTVERRNIDA
jgi:hypothetical protein